MTATKPRTAVSPTRDEDFPEWYQQVVKVAEMAENAPVRGCMTIKPWGFATWEHIQRQMDSRIKSHDVENVYFPLFIPLSYLEKEAKHIEGFAKECAVVTHHRLEAQDGKLVPAGELTEPLVVRPTSETIIGEAFSRWVQSWRDLPLLTNQWANVVRWEMRPRVFLRTAEFLWQEGHTAHASAEEAREFSMKMLEMYRELTENVLALPTICGEKSPGERFPGAENTYTFEIMMQDRKALQGGTSHYLGQNFAKGFDVTFSDQEGKRDHVYTTSWGTTTRFIGALVMVHGDDDGMRMPPRVAPKQVVILPVIPKAEMEADVLAYAEKVKKMIQESSYEGEPVRVVVDKRDIRGGEKNWGWIKKGIPLRLEVGPRDMEGNCVMMYRRDQGHKDREKVSVDELASKVPAVLTEIQSNLFEQAKAFRDEHIYTDLQTVDELRAFFTPKNPDKPEAHGGFVRAKWCEDPATEELLNEMKVTIRCLPFDQSGTTGKCILTGREATTDAIFAKSY